MQSFHSPFSRRLFLRKNVAILPFFFCLSSTACSSSEADDPEGDGDGDSSTGGALGGLETGGSGGVPGAGGGPGPGTGGSGTGGLESGTGGGDSATGGNPGTGGGENHAPRTLGYVGCSMSDNGASGYAAVGGERMWPSIPAYWGQVVQDWANPDDPVWDAFDDQVEEFGVPEEVWIMVCIFNPPGVELSEMREIVGLVRERAPNATIYTTGQPLYEADAPCTVAGEEGPQLTDDMAQSMAEDPSLTDVIYMGTFGPLSSEQKEDSCHANAAGQQMLGQQAVEFFGE